MLGAFRILFLSLKLQYYFNSHDNSVGMEFSFLSFLDEERVPEIVNEWEII